MSSQNRVLKDPSRLSQAVESGPVIERCCPSKNRHMPIKIWMAECKDIPNLEHQKQKNKDMNWRRDAPFSLKNTRSCLSRAPPLPNSSSPLNVFHFFFPFFNFHSNVTHFLAIFLGKLLHSLNSVSIGNRTFFLHIIVAPFLEDRRSMKACLLSLSIPQCAPETQRFIVIIHTWLAALDT